MLHMLYIYITLSIFSFALKMDSKEVEGGRYMMSSNKKHFFVRKKGGFENYI